MKNIYTLICLIALTFCFNSVNAQCSNGRYYNTIFPAASHLSVPYGNAVKYDGSIQNLTMDIFEPSGDNYAHRPLIILAFGGSFTSGLKESPDMLNLCNEFAKRGYVTATIDYRIGVSNGSDSEMYKAVIRGIQDMNAAIRFFYKDAYTANQYRIDTTQVFIGGTSAGAFIGLNKAYFKMTSFSRPVPQPMVNALVSLGSPEGNSGNPGYSDNIKGVIDLCGAVMDSIWIQPGDPILVGVHGTNDNTVPFYFDSIRGSTDIKADFYGGGDIINRCNHIGFNFSLYPFTGADHAPFVIPYAPGYNPVPWMDTTIWVVRDFLYQNVICDSTTVPTSVSNIAVNNFSVSLSPNPSKEQISVALHHDQDVTMELYSIDGKMLLRRAIPANSTQTISKSELGAGMYLLEFTDLSKTHILDTERIVFF